MSDVTESRRQSVSNILLGIVQLLWALGRELDGLMGRHHADLTAKEVAYIKTARASVSKAATLLLKLSNHLGKRDSFGPDATQKNPNKRKRKKARRG